MKYLYTFVLSAALLVPFSGLAAVSSGNNGSGPAPYSPVGVTALILHTETPSLAGQTGAVLEGTYSSTGMASIWFAYGTSSTNLSSTSSFKVVMAGGTSYSATLSTLSPNTTYYYQARGTLAGSGVTSYAPEIQTFRTANATTIYYECNDGDDNDGDGYTDYPSDGGCTSATDDSEDSNGGSSSNDAPDVITDDADDVQEDEATLTGEVDPNGSYTRAWFEWGEDTDMDEETNDESVGSGNGYEDISISIDDLDDDRTYYFRLCAENDYGTECGSRESFRTDEDDNNNDDDDDNNGYYYPYNNAPYYYNPLPSLIEESPDATPTIIYTGSSSYNYPSEAYDNNADYRAHHKSAGAYNYALGAGAYGAGYSPFTNAWGWIALIFIILLILVLARRYYNNN